MNPKAKLSGAIVFASVFMGSFLGAGIALISSPAGSIKDFRNKLKGTAIIDSLDELIALSKSNPQSDILAEGIKNLTASSEELNETLASSGSRDASNGSLSNGFGLGEERWLSLQIGDFIADNLRAFRECSDAFRKKTTARLDNILSPLGSSNETSNGSLSDVSSSSSSKSTPLTSSKVKFGNPSTCTYYRDLCSANPVDKYACDTEDCCRSFGNDDTANEIRECLIGKDKYLCASFDGQFRDDCRKIAHWWCYGTTLGGLKLGADALTKGVKKECEDSMDDVGGMIPFINQRPK
ncbi:secreted protein [Candidatus Magnetoovum chiemensis]|nr:secreted protein [Candidatus Magnetoovum chiemensis]